MKFILPCARWCSAAALPRLWRMAWGLKRLRKLPGCRSRTRSLVEARKTDDRKGTSNWSNGPKPLKHPRLMNRKFSRREMLSRTGQALLLGTVALPSGCISERKPAHHRSFGAVVGEDAGARVGEQVLAEGGNAIDAAVAAALTSCIATPARCGIAGYGGHMIIALAGGKKIVSI